MKDPLGAGRGRAMHAEINHFRVPLLIHTHAADSFLLISLIGALRRLDSTLSDRSQILWLGTHYSNSARCLREDYMTILI